MTATASATTDIDRARAALTETAPGQPVSIDANLLSRLVHLAAQSQATGRGSGAEVTELLLKSFQDENTIEHLRAEADSANERVRHLRAIYRELRDERGN